MLPQKLDITIALKMMNLMPELSGTDKRVCAAIIDHLRCKTAQCDPSGSHCFGFSELIAAPLLDRYRDWTNSAYCARCAMAGTFQRNSYEPVWKRFRELEVEWRARFNAKNLRFTETRSVTWPVSG